VTALDGRVERGARNREAIADALLACYEDGILRPSVAEVAARAGVSVRSVHNHFADVEALRADVAQRQWERHAALLQPAADVTALAAQRRAFFEAVTPVRRAVVLTVHNSPTITRRLAQLDRILRDQLRALFPKLDDDALDALDAIASWDAWNRLRTAQHCDADRAQHILEQTIRTLTEGTAVA
jgi:AcrR family transcriptional regulator